MKTVIVTRKIQILVDCQDKEEKKGYYTKLYEWQRICFRAANYIFTHHFIQDQLKELIYINEDIKVKLADIKKDKDGILNTSKGNTTYQILSKYFKGEIPMEVISQLNQALVSYYNQERSAYWKGEKSLRNYKRSIPIPIPGRAIKNFKPTENGREFTFTLFNIPFRTYLGKDQGDKKLLFSTAMKTENIKLCGSSIKLDQSKTYLLATFQMEKDSHILNDDVIAEASLSIEHPISLKIKNFQTNIGNKEEFLYRRLAIQSAIRRVQEGATYNKAGKGRKRKLKSLEKYKEAEKKYVTHKIHVYSRRLIDFCIKKQAGSILLINQAAKEEAAKDSEFLLRNWSYFGLKEKISYKANKAGINVIEE